VIHENTEERIEADIDQPDRHEGETDGRQVGMIQRVALRETQPRLPSSRQLGKRPEK